MQTELIPVPIRFKKNGFLYWQLCRTDKAAIYEQKEVETGQIWFEVWRIRKRPERIAFGKVCPASEITPSPEQWGNAGYTFHSLGDARKRYDQFNNRDNVLNPY
jgi:hypothetical protein